MGFLKNNLRPALALFVIAHGLAQAVMPMRGGMDPAMLGRDFMPVVLYGTSVLGFVIAGIGLFGLRPFDSATRPLLVLASGYSLVAIWLVGDPGLWFGAVTDVVLLLTGLSGAYRYLPEAGPSRGRVWHAAGVVCAVAFLAYTACAVVLWPLHRAWGSTADEYAMALPGDRPDRNPALEVQHAVTVNAALEDVWPWLTQLGQDRAGTFALVPTADGKTRFIIRTKVGDERIPAWAAVLDTMLFQLPHFIRERRMMLNIKARAEAHWI